MTAALHEHKRLTRRHRVAKLDYLYHKGFVMPVSLHLPDDLNARLSSLASRTGRSKSFYMLEAIREHLDDLEDLYLAEQRLIDARSGRSQAYTLDEVERELGLAD